ncbi:exopolysaccharide biosynthesis protein [Cyanobacteria bacterium FACHB-DQ100]|nr:exopolysaccharide biosynthesis protein [Cyanobacteria bacterium FACHB-DQ100]
MHLRFSQDIESLLKRLSEEPLTIAAILAETSERGFCLVIALLVIPFLFPVPPGLTGVPGTGCILLGMQMALGKRSPWLPKKLAQFRFPTFFARELLKNIRRVTRILEKITRPRLRRIASNPHIWQFNGLCITWLAILLIAPIPFTNPFPTIGILLLVVAMLESDGLLMCVAYGLTALITAICAVIVYLLWKAPDLINQWL